MNLDDHSNSSLMIMIPYIHPYILAFLSVHSVRWKNLLRLFEKSGGMYRSMCFWHFRNVYYIKHRHSGVLKKVTLKKTPRCFKLYKPGLHCQLHHFVNSHHYVFK